MLDGYMLEGMTGEHLLVFRSDDPELILSIIQRLQRSGNKEIKVWADKLELEWFQREANKKDGRSK